MLHEDDGRPADALACYRKAAASATESDAASWNLARLAATLQELTRTLDESKREGLWRKVGDAMFAAVPGLSLFWLPAEAVGNPKIIASWAFPGALTGTWTHIHNIRAAR